jgi:hypothetical protein
MIFKIYFYTIRSEDNWKLFSPNSGPPYPSRRTTRQVAWWPKRWNDHKNRNLGSISAKNIIFLSPTACVPTQLYPSGPPTQPVLPALCLPLSPSRCHVGLRSRESVAAGRMPNVGRMTDAGKQRPMRGGRGGRCRHGAEMRGCSMDAASDPASASDPMLPPGHSRLGEGGASGGWRRRPTLKGRGKDRAERARSYRFGRPASPRRGWGKPWSSPRRAHQLAPLGIERSAHGTAKAAAVAAVLQGRWWLAATEKIEATPHWFQVTLRRLSCESRWVPSAVMFLIQNMFIIWVSAWNCIKDGPPPAPARVLANSLMQRPMTWPSLNFSCYQVARRPQQQWLASFVHIHW